MLARLRWHTTGDPGYIRGWAVPDSLVYLLVPISRTYRKGQPTDAPHLATDSGKIRGRMVAGHPAACTETQFTELDTALDQWAGWGYWRVPGRDQRQRQIFTHPSRSPEAEIQKGTPRGVHGGKRWGPGPVRTQETGLACSPVATFTVSISVVPDDAALDCTGPCPAWRGAVSPRTVVPSRSKREHTRGVQGLHGTACDGLRAVAPQP